LLDFKVYSTPSGIAVVKAKTRRNPIFPKLTLDVSSSPDSNSVVIVIKNNIFM